MPTDETQKQKIIEVSQIYKKNGFMQFYDAFFTTIWLTAVIGLLYLVLLIVFPFAVRYLILLGSVAAICGGIIIIVQADGHISKRIIVAIIMVVFGALSFGYHFIEDTRRQLIICTRLVAIAS